MENNELQHHGTKGMKWGQRLYQNKDGSLTALGRARMGYKKRKAVQKRKATIAAKKKAEEEKNKTAKKTAEEIAKEKERVLKSRSAKELYDNAQLFDDAELNKAYNRLVLEKNIKNLQPEEVGKGKKFVSAVVEGSATISKIVGAVNKIDENLGKIADRHNPSNPSNPSKPSKPNKPKKDDADGEDTKSKTKKEKTKKESFGPDDYEILDPDDGYRSSGSNRSAPDGRTVYRTDSFVDKSVPTVVRNFVDNDVDVASSVVNFVENNPRLVEAGTNYVAGLLEKRS